MASNNRNAQFKQNTLSITLLVIVLSALLLPGQAFALGEPNFLSNFPAFVESVKDGNANALRGIYVSGVMAFPIVQQPMGNPGYVSSQNDIITQFSMASEVGNLGLLAHNHLAGATFSQLKTGATIILIYGDGHTKRFVVKEILQYQALSPASPYSDFKDINTGEIINVEQLFNKVYRGDFHLTLQTCIENEGSLSWGRLFIIAKPASEKISNILHSNLLQY